MGLATGIVGLPNVGKSTLFNAITKAGAESANYPFCTIDPNVGVVTVPDDRLQQLVDIIQPRKVIPTAAQFVDIAGLVKGASKGEGLGNKFLAHIREVDAIIHVVRCFADEQVIHVAGKVDPVADLETINLELVLADIETVDRRIDRLQKQLKSGDKLAALEMDILQRLQKELHEGRRAQTVSLSTDEQKVIKSLNLLTLKNMIYVANVQEKDLAAPFENPFVQQMNEVAELEGALVIPICAQVEAEIAELDDTEKDLFLKEMGLIESGMDRLIAAAYASLDLVTFFTAGEKEVRAWTIRKGMLAPQAAGVIHTDFERGFIRAETISYRDLLNCGSLVTAKEKGLLRLEGKEYLVQDGDVLTFRFSV